MDTFQDEAEDEGSEGEVRTFESIKRTKGRSEYWLARELQTLLGYKRWESFSPVIDKAKESCLTSGQEVADHFRDTTEMVDIGSGAKRRIRDVAMSRYACYLAVQNGDPNKHAIAAGQRYFAIRTRQQELREENFAGLSEDERRLMLRQEMIEHNKALTAAAKDAGVSEGVEFAIFQDHGYKGLYGDLAAKDIQRRKGLKKSQRILDYMGSTELAANLFRATQTEEKLRRDKIQGKDRANRTHYEVGRKVRETIAELGGTMPEDLPTPTKSIQQITKEQKQLEKRDSAEVQLPSLGPEIAEEKASVDAKRFLNCPACREDDLQVGGGPAICDSCGTSWDPAILAEEITDSGVYTCPHCSEQCVSNVSGIHLCLWCTKDVLDTDLICTSCSSPVPFSEFGVFEDTRCCGWCAMQLEDEADTANLP